jgi:hypothetical protein
MLLRVLLLMIQLILSAVHHAGCELLPAITAGIAGDDDTVALSLPD